MPSGLRRFRTQARDLARYGDDIDPEGCSPDAFVDAREALGLFELTKDA